MATIGKFNTLEVVAITDQGTYLHAGELGEIILPKRFTPNNCQLGDEINVFIYNFSQIKNDI